MTVTIDPNAGFCFVVTNAIKAACEYLRYNDELFCLGELVHNEEEMNKLKQIGLKIINHDNLNAISSSVILFRAHGEPAATYSKVRSQENRIIDATCPIVKALQKKVIESYNNDERIFIYGKLSHPEIQGIIGNIDNDAVVFTDIDEISYLKPGDNITLYSQTTMSLDDYKDIINKLTERGINVKAINSVCNSVSKRREALIDFCRNHDVIIFVAGKNSSNGKSLFSACKEINPNSHLISSVDEINMDWFKGYDTVGISGATSTPLDLLEKVKMTIYG